MADVSSWKIGGTTYQIKDATARAGMDGNIITVNVPSFSSFPQTISDPRITASHVLLNCSFGSPEAIQGDVTWTTSTGKIVLNGNIGGTSTAQIVLGKSAS